MRCRCCIITIVLFWVQRRITSRKGYVSLTGKGGERREVPLGPWKWVVLGYCLFVCTLSFFMPLVVICQAAFAKAWGRGFSLDNLTFNNIYAHGGRQRPHAHGDAAHLPVCGHGIADRHRAGAVRRLHRQPRAGQQAGRQRARAS